MKHIRLFLLLLAFLVVAGCQTADVSVLDGDEPMTMTVTSNAFVDEGQIPVKYTCDGENLSPQIGWDGVPAKTKNLVVIMDDPDAPMGTYVHWVLYGLPVEIEELPEGVQDMGVSGVNSSRKSIYNGPCPPRGSEHHYYFKVYALDQTLDLAPGASKADVESAMQGHILAWGELVGLYRRQ